MEDLNGAPAIPADRQVGGEENSETGPMTDVQRAMPSTSPAQIATRPVAGLMGDLDESPEWRGNRQPGGEDTLEAGPMTDIQRAMPSTSGLQIATGPGFMQTQLLTPNPGLPHGTPSTQHPGTASAPTLPLPEAMQHPGTSSAPPPRRNALAPAASGVIYEALRNAHGHLVYAPIHSLMRPTLFHARTAPTTTTHGIFDQANTLAPFLPQPGMFNLPRHNVTAAPVPAVSGIPALPSFPSQDVADMETSISGLGIQPVTHIDPQVLLPTAHDDAQIGTGQPVEAVAQSSSGETLTAAERARMDFEMLCEDL